MSSIFGLAYNLIKKLLPGVLPYLFLSLKFYFRTRLKRCVIKTSPTTDTKNLFPEHQGAYSVEQL